MLDEQFNHIATLNPGKVLNYDEKEERFKVYDMCYISPKDMYALVASDHSITVYREHMAVVSDSERERERETPVLFTIASWVFTVLCSVIKY